MNKDFSDAISLDDVAPDAVALVEAFRTNVGVSFQDAPLTEVRANYLKSCAINGLKKQDVGSIKTLEFPVENGFAALRIYRASGLPADQKTPLTFFIHGGGWVIGDLDSHDSLCRYLANHTQSTVVAVDYRRAPEYKFPIPLNDCRDALTYVMVHADEWQLDLSTAVIVGDSAGGNMATVLANQHDYRPEGMKFAAQVLFYPVTDLTAGTTSYQNITSGFALTAESMYWFREMYTSPGTDLTDELLSPLLRKDRSIQPSMFIVTVGLDPLADEGIEYAARAARSGTRVIHHHLPKHMHGIFTAAGKIDTGRELLEKAASFINAVQQPIDVR
ncbi:alpha/beta hydrolase [Pseudomonas sp. TH31]|uniref:alpha/beta hydrolase n=1 Tax=Pseudomonas sp. TH31 TaxID=2796396 RepID=UPI0019143638|nr:alpha/beta hydrolase [Pseudomonas sp. TH31]MBK5413248.1 alpha/beta hydrolase [Pseudomonas sp. TH31]